MLLLLLLYSNGRSIQRYIEIYKIYVYVANLMACVVHSAHDDYFVIPFFA